MQAAGTDCKDLSPAENTGSASKQEGSEAETAKQPPGASQTSADPVPDVSDSLLGPTTPAQSSEPAATSTSPSLSPQPTLQLGTGMPQGQQEADLPGLASPAARAAEAAAREEEPGQEPWQEVRASRRKPVSQGASSAGSREAQKQSRHSCSQEDAAVSPLRLRAVKTAAQNAEQAPLKLEKAAELPQPQAGHAASKQLLDRLSALSISQSQQPSQQNEEDQDDEDLCIVCWERAREVIFYHCMHMVRSPASALLKGVMCHL